MWQNTNPIDEVCLEELDELEGDLETDGNHVVVEDEEGEEVENEVGRRLPYKNNKCF